MSEDVNRREFLRLAGLTGVAAVLGPGLLEACGGSSGGESTLDKAKKAGYIRVGFANEAPYGFADASGKLSGEAPTVAREIMKGLGVSNLEGVLTEFGALIPGLLANRFDMIAAGMFITPQRCQQILFSNPDYVATEALAVRSGNPENITDYASIAKNSRVIVGAESGAVEGGWLQDSGVPMSRIQLLPNGPTGMQALSSGRIQAFALTSISLQYLIKTGGYSGLQVTEPFIPVIKGKKQASAGGYGFRKSEGPLVSAFNSKLAELQKSGKLQQLVEPFGFTGQTVTAASDLTSQQACKG
jgi:polar amino acid transport system substrate-binding protein